MKLSPEFRQSLVAAITDDRLVLPSLSDIAQRATELSRQEDVTAARLAAEIGRDPAIAARIMRVANSAAHQGATPVRTLQHAITRLGIHMTRLLVGALSAEQLYRAKSPVLTARLRRSWADSLEIAALSRTIARRHTRLDPDEAMLAGLMHGVGILPIMAVAANEPGLVESAEALDEAILLLQAQVGARLLTAWHFPASIVAVPRGCVDFAREGEGPADLSDVVCVALLQTAPARGAWLAGIDRGRVPAYTRLGIDPAAGVLATQEFLDEFRQSHALLAA